ncbi:MAG: hypothetical protein ABI222_11845, partial [Opitutaceae bacterium]
MSPFPICSMPGSKMRLACIGVCLLGAVAALDGPVGYSDKLGWLIVPAYILTAIAVVTVRPTNRAWLGIIMTIAIIT